MVCAMHRLFQSEEDDRIMEGEIIQDSCQTKDETTKKEPPKATLRSKIVKSLGNIIKTKISK